MPLTEQSLKNLIAEKNILVSATNKELADYAIDEISKRLATERQRKSKLAAEGKTSPIADKRVAVYEEQLIEMRVAKLSGHLNFRSMTEKDLLYHAIHNFNEKLYGDTKPQTLSAGELSTIKKQYNEIHNRIVQIEKSINKEHDNMSKCDISARVNPFPMPSKL